MTRNEIAELGLGSQLRLITGDVVEVISINQQEETITFEYLAPPLVSQKMRKEMQARASTFISHKLYRATPQSPEDIEERKAVHATVNQNKSTTVICDWAEIASAVQLG